MTIEDELKKKLDPKHVSTRQQAGRTLSYVEGWHVIDTANRIFGFDNWSSHTEDLAELASTTYEKNGKTYHKVSYKARCVISVEMNGQTADREGYGFGSGISTDIHDAYEGAIKEAETDARKRAFMTFGNQFGLALYDKSQANVGVDKPKPTPEQQVKIDWIEKELATIANLDTAQAVTKHISEKAFTDVQSTLSDKQKKYVNDKISNRISQLSQQPLEEGVAAE